jgi:hypothetical protein
VSQNTGRRPARSAAGERAVQIGRRVQGQGSQWPARGNQRAARGCGVAGTRGDCGLAQVRVKAGAVREGEVRSGRQAVE